MDSEPQVIDELNMAHENAIKADQPRIKDRPVTKGKYDYNRRVSQTPSFISLRLHVNSLQFLNSYYAVGLN